MPQMAPLWWEILFIVFVMLFIMINIFIYFSPNNSLKKINKKSELFKELTWKW
uniref:ATP synthase complex subunit 8 n=1 Tax=Scotinophara lurida TaxID=1331320 RepID=A0A4D6X1B1_9HEMI|nr:ATP synthase F0 subunit 8 [Scotinophara lurida]QCI09446.1 ATP synthase F0 subunit 8 [Scotinophara lurida]